MPEINNNDGRGEIKLPRISYKVGEAAQLLGVSPITIRRAITAGLLKPCRAFRHPLIPAVQLQKLLENGEVSQRVKDSLTTLPSKGGAS